MEITRRKTEIQNDDVAISEQVASAVKKRGPKLGSIEANTTATRKDMRQIYSNVLYWYKQEPVVSDDDCEQRLEQFFQRGNETGEILTVEKMCLALGTTRQRVNEWEHGSKGNRRADIIKRAKETMAAVDAELANNNMIPQVVYIFRSKNYYNLSDKTEVVLTPNSPLDGKSEEELATRYITGAVKSEE